MEANLVWSVHQKLLMISWPYDGSPNQKDVWPHHEATDQPGSSIWRQCKICDSLNRSLNLSMNPVFSNGKFTVGASQMQVSWKVAEVLDSSILSLSQHAVCRIILLPFLSYFHGSIYSPLLRYTMGYTSCHCTQNLQSLPDMPKKQRTREPCSTSRWWCPLCSSS